jgi:titin
VVAWEVPESDGGSPITKYKVEPRGTTKNSWIVVGTTKPDTLTIKATKLTEGHEYDFRVVAENDIGVSDPCQTEAPIMAKLPFGWYFQIIVCKIIFYIRLCSNCYSNLKILTHL